MIAHLAGLLCELNISCVSKPMSQTFPGYYPPPIKQKSSYQHGLKVNRFWDVHWCVEIREMLWLTRNTLLWVMLSVWKVCSNSYPVSSVSIVTWTDNSTIKAVAGCTQLEKVKVVTCVWFMKEAEDYTFAEMADIHFFYGCANGNAHEARRMYQETFPNRRLTCSRTFSRIPQRLWERGTFIPVIEGGRPRTARTVQQEQQILVHVAANPGTSTRRISSAEGVHSSTVWRILHEDRLYPYNLQRVQVLNPDDLPLLVRFCQWCLEQCDRHRQFLWKLLFTDEAMFTPERIFNFHNVHIWAQAIPHDIRETRHQTTFSINVWAAIFGVWLIGPIRLPERLTGAYVPGIFGTSDARHLSWCAWWCSLAFASRHAFHAWWGSTIFQPHSTSIPE
jgi:hypothetical protein